MFNTQMLTGKKLEEACNQQKFDRSVKDVDLWLDEVENQLNTDELGKVQYIVYY